MCPVQLIIRVLCIGLDFQEIIVGRARLLCSRRFVTGHRKFVLINPAFVWLAGLDEVFDRLKLRIVAVLMAQVHARSALKTVVPIRTMLLLLQIAAARASRGLAVRFQVLHCNPDLFVHGGLQL